MFLVIVLTCTSSVSLIFWLERKHPDRFVGLGGRRIWTTAQFAYLGFLWRFRYLTLRDPVVTALGLATQLGSIAAVYLIFKHPNLYFVAQ